MTRQKYLDLEKQFQANKKQQIDYHRIFSAFCEIFIYIRGSNC